MTDTFTCEAIERLGTVERYVAGTLDADAVEAFEDHFLGCERCQSSIKLAVAVRAAARGRTLTPAKAVPAHAALHAKERRAFRISAAITAIAAVIVGAIVMVRGSDARALRSLGELSSPPAYAGVQVRGAATAADSLFGAAMRAYVAGDYATATSGLRAALGAGAAPAPAQFFLGASLLMQRRADDAAKAFAQVIAAGWSPYLEEARYYRALALLQTNDADGAIAELRLAGGGTDATATRARELLAAVEAQRAR